MKSIWNMDCDIPEREALNQDITVDTAIIGAGMAGLLSAYFLQKHGQKVVVLEGNRIA
ncbi:MAG: FAD-dependent oxidoreductase, partial [Clostridia bacterium]|nr:FAD-dependent oxidoreductase [Clostridia bacterium]